MIHEGVGAWTLQFNTVWFLIPPPRRTYKAFSILSNQNLKKILLILKYVTVPRVQVRECQFMVDIWYNKLNLPICIS